MPVNSLLNSKFGIDYKYITAKEKQKKLAEMQNKAF